MLWCTKERKKRKMGDRKKGRKRQKEAAVCESKREKEREEKERGNKEVWQEKCVFGVCVGMSEKK